MRKLLLVILIFFVAQTSFAAFPGFKPADSAQHTSLSIHSTDNLDSKEYRHPVQTHLSLLQKFGIVLFHQLPEKHKHKKSQWLVVAAGILLGLTGVGFVISLLTHNENLRNGAAIGFRVLLYVCAIYLLALLAVVLLFASLGLI